MGGERVNGRPWRVNGAITTHAGIRSAEAESEDLPPCAPRIREKDKRGQDQACQEVPAQSSVPMRIRQSEAKSLS